MPLYEFHCLSCNKKYSELTKYDESGIYPDIECPHCSSTKKEKLMSTPAITFANPKESSKWDSFSYRAGHNLEKAQQERRVAESLSHMGGTKEIYNDLNDANKLGEGLHDLNA